MAETTGIVFPTLDAEGNTRTVQEPLGGTEVYFFSPNVCDPTSWYEDSGTITEEALTDSGDLTTWEGASHTNWIDLKHGKVMAEDDLVTADPTLAVKVEVQEGGVGDWVLKTENSMGQSDGDYSVDYVAGTVTFNAALPASSNVRASYRYATAFCFTVQPAAGKILKVNYVEIQFSDDVDPTGDAVFQISVYNPQDPAWDPPTSMPKMVYTQRVYKNMFNYYGEATGPFAVQPPVGTPVVVEATGIAAIQAKVREGYHILSAQHNGTDWVALLQGVDSTSLRAQPYCVRTLPFKYLAYRALASSMGAEIKVVLTNGAFNGSWANFTFYTLTGDE